MALGGRHTTLGKGPCRPLHGGFLFVLIGGQTRLFQILKHGGTDVGNDDGIGTAVLDEVDDGPMALLVGVVLHGLDKRERIVGRDVDEREVRRAAEMRAAGC